MKKPQKQSSELAITALLSPNELSSISDAIAGEFPGNDDRPGLILMDVDPFHLHVFWNEPPESIEAARRVMTHGDEPVHLVIRFRELAAENPPMELNLLPLEVFDLELESSHGDAQVRLSGNGRSFEAELGLTARDGGWLSLARSNPVRLPPAAPVKERGFDTWDMREALPPVERISEQLVETQAPSTEVPELDPSLRGGGPDELPTRFPNPGLQSRSEAQTVSRSVDSATSADEPARQDTLKRVAVDLPHREEDVAVEGAELALPGQAPQPQGHQGGSASSSYSMVRELYAELHIWGRVEPGQRAELLGHNLPVMPDGQFSLTLPLDTSDPMLPLLLGQPRQPKKPS